MTDQQEVRSEPRMSLAYILPQSPRLKYLFTFICFDFCIIFFISYTFPPFHLKYLMNPETMFYDEQANHVFCDHSLQLLKMVQWKGKTAPELSEMARSQKEPYLKPGQAVNIALLDMPHILLPLLSKYLISINNPIDIKNGF